MPSLTAEGKIVFTVPVKNTGKVAGSEVVQLYITDVKASVDRPVKELKGFSKVYLEPGQTTDVVIEVDGSSLGFFDADKHAWVTEPGDYIANAGSSSRDLRTKVKFKVN